MHFDYENLTSNPTKVCIQTGHKLTFKCKFALGTRTVSSNYDVTGHDTNVDAVGRGELKYGLTVKDKNVDIGEDVEVTITPANKNLVYAAVQDCNVHYGGDSVSILDFSSGLKVLFKVNKALFQEF